MDVSEPCYDVTLRRYTLEGEEVITVRMWAPTPEAARAKACDLEAVSADAVIDVREPPPWGDTMPATGEPTPQLPGPCGLCGSAPAKGWAQAGDTWLCHPDEGQDCYHLWAVYGVRSQDAVADAETHQAVRAMFPLQLRAIAAQFDDAEAPGPPADR